MNEYSKCMAEQVAAVLRIFMNGYVISRSIISFGIELLNKGINNK